MSGDLASELPQALDRDEIIPFFQPLVELAAGRVTGFEALARWRHPVRQIIPPAEFIPLAEKAGLIAALGERVLGHACLAAADWPPEIQLCVNVSPLQLRDPAAAERLSRVVERAGLPLNRITLEITEGAVVEDLEVARRILGNLKSQGARLSLDDFGTGYSGLRRLQMLPFDSLKIDAGFVREMTTHRESRMIVSAVMGLCQNLGLEAVAEGIETRCQLEMLQRLGYRSGQGWLFGHAEPAADAAAMLRAARQPLSEPSVSSIAEEVALRLEALPIQCLWQLRAVYDGAPVGLAFLDRNFHYLAANERFAEMHGLPIAAFLGRAVAEVDPNLASQIEPLFRRALAGESVKDVKTYYRRGDEPRARALQSSYQPVQDVAGEVVGVSLAVVDVADRRARRVSKRPQQPLAPIFQRYSH